jgi:hypothetical protein
MAIWSKIKGYVIASVGSLAAVWAIYWAGRRRGIQNEQIKRERADYEASRTIQDKADRVRRATDKLPAVSRLQRYKKLRDFSDDL